MMEALQKDLCAAFCAALEVHPVPSGYAVSTAFTDSSGDKITFYISETPDGYQVEDDGDFLATLVASGVPIDTGTRAALLEAILQEGRAYWDRETYEIKTEPFAAEELSGRSVDFLSSLIRVRDLAKLTRERVKSAFREDFLSAVTAKFGQSVTIAEGVAPANDLEEFPADLVLEPALPGAKRGAIYLVNSNDKLNEALLAWQELRLKPHGDIALMAVLEDSDMKQISRRKWQRAQNRRLPMPVFRGDESGMLTFISQELGIAQA